MLFGNKIKELRDEQGLLQRQLAAFLEIDTPMFSKIERGDRRAKREQVIKLAEYLHQDKKEMLTLWLADKFIDAVEDEQEHPAPEQANNEERETSSRSEFTQTLKYEIVRDSMRTVMKEYAKQQEQQSNREENNSDREP